MSGFTAPPSENSLSVAFRRWLDSLARASYTIPQYTSDPTAPKPGDVWVLFSGGTYQLSYATKAGTIVRETLT